MWISKPVSKFSFLGLIIINVQFAGRLFELNNLPYAFIIQKIKTDIILINQP